jgi:hypothetical protein
MASSRKSGLVSRRLVDTICAELAAQGFTLFAIDKPSDTSGFFSLVKSAFPLDPPISGRIHWDAFDDSLWGGLDEVESGKVALVVRDAVSFRTSNYEDFQLAIEIIERVASEVQQEKRNEGDPAAEILVIVGVD